MRDGDSHTRNGQRHAKRVNRRSELQQPQRLGGHRPREKNAVHKPYALGEKIGGGKQPGAVNYRMAGFQNVPSRQKVCTAYAKRDEYMICRGFLLAHNKRKNPTTIDIPTVIGPCAMVAAVIFDA